MDSNNQIWEEWGENKNTLMYMNFYSSWELDKAFEWETNYNMKLPILWWDLPGTQENTKLRNELLAATGNGNALGGSIYIIKPNMEVVYFSEGVHNLRNWLEENNIPKTGGTPVEFYTYNSFITKSENVFIKENKLGLSVRKDGNYGLYIFNMSGKEIDCIKNLNLNKGIQYLDFNNNLSSGNYMIKLLTPNGVSSHKIILE